MNASRVECGSTRRWRKAALLLASFVALSAHGGEAADAARGRELLLTKPYLPADFDQDIFDQLWTLWPEPFRNQAEKAPLEERRRMAMERYGLTPHPDEPSRPLQYVVGRDGLWTMNCLACHQGQVDGRVIPGLPNSNYALETLTEEVRLAKVKQRKPFGHMDLGSLLLPLGTTNGTTNAVIFGVALMRHRDKDLNIIQRPPRFDLVHHDMDAPAWWHARKKTGIYADGFAPKGHRMLMQFQLVKENGPGKFADWEDDFRDIGAWIDSLESPPWPWGSDAGLAERGREVFASHCASCHGSYGPEASYPEKVVAIEEIGTDRVRFDSLTIKDRSDLNESWFGHRGRDAERLRNREPPTGYVAPPLDGLWATAPYFHNGSVPTLWHLLHPAQRPAVWQRAATGYDRSRVGLEIEELAALPPGKLTSAERRTWFDTSKPGKSAAGHDFPDALDEDEKTALLEYLKTL